MVNGLSIMGDIDNIESGRMGKNKELLIADGQKFLFNREVDVVFRVYMDYMERMVQFRIM